MSTRVARQIAKERKRRHLSQVELAEQAGVGQATVSRIEAGEDVGLVVLSAVAEVLGARVDVRLVRSTNGNH